MTLLGKVFTVLIFVMSVVFMAFAVVVYATHVNWKLKVTGPGGLQTQVQATQTTIDQLRVDLERSKGALAREQAARRFVIAALRTKLETDAAELRAKVAEFDEQQATLNTLTQANDTASTTLARLTKEVTDLRDQIIKTIDDRNAEFTKVVQLTDDKNKLEGTRLTLTERYNNLTKDLTRAQGLLESAGMRLGDPILDTPPDVRGVVTNVSEANLIEISLGDDDGIREGHQLFVYRGGTYLGRAVVRRTSADFAVAEIVQEFNKSVLIRKGDNVATKLG